MSLKEWCKSFLRLPSRTTGTRAAGPLSMPAHQSDVIQVAPPQAKAAQVKIAQVTTQEEQISSLIAQLGRVDRTEMRRDAAEALAVMGPAASRSVARLIEASVDIDASVRAAAVSALKAISPGWPDQSASLKVIPLLTAALNSRSQAVNAAAMQMLRQIGPLALPELMAMLFQPDSARKVYALRLIAMMRARAIGSGACLGTALASEIVQVRVAAAEALELAGPGEIRAAIPDLSRALADPYAEVRAAAARCLAVCESPPEEAIRALFKLLGDREVKVREAAVNAVAKVGSALVPALVEVIERRNARRAEAGGQFAFQIAHVRCGPLINASQFRNLEWVLTDSFQQLKGVEEAHESALKLLNHFGAASEPAVPAITGALRDQNPMVRYEAARALGSIGQAACFSISALLAMLVEPLSHIRSSAMASLIKIDDRWAHRADVVAFAKGLHDEQGRYVLLAMREAGASALPALIAALESQDRAVREQAVSALGSLGRDAALSIPALEKLVREDHPWIQSRAAQALKCIVGHV